MGRSIEDRANKNFLQLPANMSVGAALEALPDSTWVVIMTEVGLAIGIANLKDLQDYDMGVMLGTVARKLPLLVVVDADASASDAVLSPAFNRLALGQPVLVEHKHRGAVAGVWVGEDLKNALSYQGRRGADSIDGNVRIAHIRRQCGYSDGTDYCTAVRIFFELPDQLPECNNPGELPSHRFIW